MGPIPDLILSSVANILLFTQNPRFILDIRELYTQSFHSQDIDTGFGTLSCVVTNIGTTLHFADPGLERRSDEVEEIPMEEQST